MIRVMLVDDQEMIRVGLTTIIDATEGIHVAASAPDGLAALRILESTQIDVILMDLHMPGIDGVETTRRVRQHLTSQSTKIVVLTTFDQDENVLKALKAGADGFLSKGVGPTELANFITEVAHGGGALSAKAAATLISHVAGSRDVVTDPEAVHLIGLLTQREREIVEAATEGLDNAQIAARFHISQFTVKTHVNRAMMKVDAHDRAGLVTLAYKAGIMPQ